jgi:5'-3' exonuclease
MGIPSYYKKLTDTHPGLVLTSHPVETISWLFMDFNCLIYHCIQQPDMTAYTVESEAEWEEELLARVVNYTKHIVSTVAPQEGVYIAIDGVVPMAKMRQQRLRRFKSQWLKRHSETTSWNTNAITPGTLFMEKLHRVLNDAAKQSSKRWVISDSNAPGEGEHKIIAEWQRHSIHYENGHHAVYGLDADLIVLTLLKREVMGWNHKIWLFRESMDKGACVYQAGQECFEWFCIHELHAWLTTGMASANVQREWILSYCLAMSVLGNDFLPRSLSFTLREDGHAELLSRLRCTEGCLVDPETLRIQPSALFSFFQQLAADEPFRMKQTLLKRVRMAQLYGSTESGLGESNWPLTQLDEQVVMCRGELKDDWETVYRSRFFPGFTKNAICSDYLYGIQWTWAYYTGVMTEVCYDWYYPHSLPPLWSWLTNDTMPLFPGKEPITADQISPQEQLSIVLPSHSWHLIRDPAARMIRKKLPHYFPTDFSFESVGKRYFWECEAMIPMPSLAEIKAVMRKGV